MPIRGGTFSFIWLIPSPVRFRIARSGVPAKLQPHGLLQSGRRYVETSNNVIDRLVSKSHSGVSSVKICQSLIGGVVQLPVMPLFCSHFFCEAPCIFYCMRESWRNSRQLRANLPFIKSNRKRLSYPRRYFRCLSVTTAIVFSAVNGKPFETFCK